MVGQQGLVGGDHVLAPLDGGQDEVPGRGQAADELHHDVDLGVVQDVLGPGGKQRPVHRHRPGALQVQVRHLGQHQFRPQAPGQHLPLLGEQAHHAAAHGPEAQQPYFNGFHSPQGIS